ncbi:TonB-dependent receptor [Phenylobacterium sp.]|uniref:TonB-dependent receptor n=1 Tax=Phenylobacterium sp. TaxID=1871053 RepID=UPI0035B453E8
MRRSLLSWACGALLATAPGAACAQGGALPVDVAGGALQDALLELARETGVDLLFDAEDVARLRAPPLRGRMSPEAAIGMLLQGTGLAARPAGAGAFVIERRSGAADPPEPATVPELLVVGRRSQNADIRRLETDIQPYRVVTGLQVLQADRDSLDHYFSSRVPANTTAIRPTQELGGEAQSLIDLRGLGETGTLSLVDGRRLPSAPAPLRGYRQADLSAVPLHAIERVEILTGAAGGIHGFGALGGVVNVVIDRARQGAELHVTGGMASRGDARHLGLEGRIGHTSGDGRTDVMLFAGRTWSEPLLAGDRGYLEADLALSTANAPLSLLSLRPNGDSLFVRNLNGPGTVFRLKPEFGGGVFDGRFTYLPPGLSGAPAEVGAALARNAGRADTELPAGAATSWAMSTPQTSALLANLRHRFDGGFEAYLDAVVLSSRGRYVGEFNNQLLILNAQSPYNPFQHSVELAFPLAGFRLDRRTRLDTTRYSAGLVAPLPRGWRANADLAVGGATSEQDQTQVQPDPNFNGRDPDLNPFGDWRRFQAALLATRRVSTSAQTLTNRFRDASLRLAGPLFRTPGGVSTLTLLAEGRREHAPSYVSLTGTLGVHSSQTIAARSNLTTSLYGELRAPLLGAAAPALLRELEVQVAVRHDRERSDFARNPRNPAAGQLRAKFAGTAYTVGAKVRPLPGLLLRGSYATGETPPSLASLIEQVSTTRTALNDPQRGGVGAPTPPTYTLRCCGDPDLDTVRVSTASAGLLLAPFGPRGPELTLDYSRIRKTREVFFPTAELVLAQEAAWPERVVRGPLGDTDRGRGFTAGPVTVLDVRPESTAGLKIDTLDARVTWSLVRGDQGLRLYAEGSHYIRQTQTAPFRDGLQVAGYYGRPLRWRGVAGAEWSRGPFSVGASLQYFGSYRIYPAGQFADGIALAAGIQGDDEVPAQSYLDLHLGWRGAVPVQGARRDLRVDLGVVNVFDKAPPRESRFALTPVYGTNAPYSPAYSRYGDPRQRRFVLTVSTAL